MILYLRYTLGLLATVAGYGLAAAAACVALIPDFVGQLPHMMLLCAIGAGVLGLVGWLLSERLAEPVNLNTVPFARLALAGVAAIVLTTDLIGPFAALAVGTPASWVPPVLVASYVGIGLPLLAAILTLLTVLETILAAQRGGASIVDSIRPLAYQALAAALVTGAIGYGLVEYATFARERIAAVAPKLPRSSPWNARQAALFEQVLAAKRCEVLVAPFEAGSPSVDRVARSLMSRLLAAELEARGRCVADPTLVARALGATRRQADPLALRRVAGALGARWVVRGEVTLDAEGRYAVALKVLQPSETGFSHAQSVQLAPTAFSDAQPPEAVFARTVRETVDSLAFAERGSAAEAPGPKLAMPSLAEEPLGLAEDPGLPRLRALRLQLLAALRAPGDIDGEHLWERSLLALRDADDEFARVLRARAALHLYRRPYATALLQGLRSKEADIVRASAGGDLPALESVPYQAVDPTFWLVTRIEAERLRQAYGSDAGAEQRIGRVLEAFPAYRAWLAPALTPHAEGLAARVAHVTRALQALGVHPEPTHWSGLLHALAVVGWSVPIAMPAVDLEETYAPLWLARRRPWLEQPAADRLAVWDVFDALYAAHRAHMVTALADQITPQITADELVRLGRLLALRLGGYPALTATLARASQNLAARTTTTQAGLFAFSARALVRDVNSWEQGESALTQNLAALAVSNYQDEPAREWRFAAAGVMHKNDVPSEQDLAELLRGLELTTWRFDYLVRAFGLLRKLNREGDGQQLLEQHRARFVGHPAREGFLLARAQERADLPVVAELLHARLTREPQAWDIRVQLARTWLLAGDAEAAQRTLSADPLVANAQAPAADRAQRLHDGALVLHFAGESVAAAPLFEHAAAAAPESVPGMHSAQLLLHIRGDYRAARDKAQQLYDRHASATALSDVAHYSFMLGEIEVGWRAFYEASRVAQDYRPWSAALAGHRVADSKRDDIVKFVQLWKGVSPQPQADALRKEHFAFNYALVDRAPSDDALQFVRSFGGKSGEDYYQVSAEAYAAWLGGKYARAAELLTPELRGPSARKVSYALPYLASALAWSNRASDARSLLEAYQARFGGDFHAALTRAYLDGIAGHHDAARHALREAMLVRPNGDSQAMPPSFQLLEACEMLLRSTGEGAYRDLLLDFARREQRVWPDAWTFAVEAHHASDAATRQRALAVALYLDAQSVRLLALPEAERKRAQRWLADNKPF